jgi:hypothetical protein
VNQLELISLVLNGAAQWTWVPLARDLEVMAWPARVGDVFVAVSARTASACAAALSHNGWITSLSTARLEDEIYERAVLCPAPILLDLRQHGPTSPEAVIRHSRQLLGRVSLAPRSALVACGKSWVLDNALLDHPGQAAMYGLFAPSAPFRSVTGAHPLWQPLSFERDLDYWDYSQLLRLVRRRPGVPLPSYDAPLRVVELVRTLTPSPPPPVAETQAVHS